MRVLHINTAQGGGAALCAIRINHALMKEGVESQMLFAEGHNLPEGVLGAVAEMDGKMWKSIPILRGIIWRVLRYIPYFMNVEKLQRLADEININHLYIHIPMTRYKNIAHHPLIKWADIIHLHWVAEFVDYPSFFKEVNKPIVWTLHDKYPAVGVQHYATKFFPVPDNLKNLNRYCIQIKRKGVCSANNLNIVALSNYTKALCENSEVLKGFPVSIIHNGVDTSVFQPSSSVRGTLGIDKKATVFMFSSFSIWNKNKGLDRVLTALELVKARTAKLITLIVVGNNFDQTREPSASFSVISVGFVEDQSKLAKLYSTSDYFINASYEETFCQTLVESLACGTPVITTPCGTPVITTPCGGTGYVSSFNGVVTDDFMPESIAKGIIMAMNRTYDIDEIRNDVLDRFSYDKISKQYLRLYEEILGKRV